MPRLILPLLLAANCTVSFAVAPGPIIPPVNHVAAAANRFTFAYLEEAERVPPAGANFIASPLGVYLAMALTQAGSAGDTRDEMAAGLFYPKAPATSPDLCGFVSALRPGPVNSGTTFDIASAVFSDSTRVTLKPEYVRLAANDFSAGVTPVDFSKPSAACGVMNAWIKEKTRGKIPAMLKPDDIDPSMALALVNAVYFKSRWLDEFDAYSTYTENFTTASGQVVRAKLMRDLSRRPYAEDGDFLYTELPYLSSEYALALVLPSNPGTTPVLTGDTFAKLVSSARADDVAVVLPRFKVSRRMAAGPVLEKLGFARAFSPGADFSAMGIPSSGSLRIGKVLHEAVIEVDEKGTEAAAATVVAMPFGNVPRQPPKPKLVRCDRPFRFFLLHKATGAILFAGRVDSPVAVSPTSENHKAGIVSDKKRGTVR